MFNIYRANDPFFLMGLMIYYSSQRKKTKERKIKKDIQ